MSIPFPARGAASGASQAPPQEPANPKDGSILARVPAGEFLMGSSDALYGPELDETGADEKPRHRVVLDGFSIGKHEVTVARYARFCAETGRTLHEQPTTTGPDHPNPLQSTSKGSDLPVVNVSWFDAQAYCEWAGMRLPTEAEWEKAARGGAETWFWWGDVAEHSHANYDSEGLTPAGSYPPNQYGLFDTAGNVWEWCADWYAEDYYAASPGRNPRGPEAGKTKIHRGGSWMNYPYYLRPAIRYCSAPERRSKLMGFRCASSE